MEIGIIEGATALYLSIIKHILTSNKKSTTYFFMKFTEFEEWMVWYILWRFQIKAHSIFNILPQCFENKSRVQVCY